MPASGQMSLHCDWTYTINPHAMFYGATLLYKSPARLRCLGSFYRANRYLDSAAYCYVSISLVVRNV